MAGTAERKIRWAGICVVALSLLSVLLAFIRPLYHPPTPGGDEGAAVFVYVALLLFPPGVFLLAVTATLRLRKRCGAIANLLRILTALVCGAAIGLAAMLCPGSLRAGRWPIAIGLLGAILSLICSGGQQS